jgi:hypothetical protein
LRDELLGDRKTMTALARELPASELRRAAGKAVGHRTLRVSDLDMLDEPQLLAVLEHAAAATCSDVSDVSGDVALWRLVTRSAYGPFRDLEEVMRTLQTYAQYRSSDGATSWYAPSTEGAAPKSSHKDAWEVGFSTRSFSSRASSSGTVFVCPGGKVGVWMAGAETPAEDVPGSGATLMFCDTVTGGRFVGAGQLHRQLSGWAADDLWFYLHDSDVSGIEAISVPLAAADRAAAVLFAESDVFPVAAGSAFGGVRSKMLYSGRDQLLRRAAQLNVSGRTRMSERELRSAIAVAAAELVTGGTAGFTAEHVTDEDLAQAQVCHAPADLEAAVVRRIGRKFTHPGADAVPSRLGEEVPCVTVRQPVNPFASAD